MKSGGGLALELGLGLWKFKLAILKIGEDLLVDRNLVENLGLIWGEVVGVRVGKIVGLTVVVWTEVAEGA